MRRSDYILDDIEQKLGINSHKYMVVKSSIDIYNFINCTIINVQSNVFDIGARDYAIVFRACYQPNVGHWNIYADYNVGSWTKDVIRGWLDLEEAFRKDIRPILMFEGIFCCGSFNAMDCIKEFQGDIRGYEGWMDVYRKLRETNRKFSWWAKTFDERFSSKELSDKFMEQEKDDKK